MIFFSSAASISPSLNATLFIEKLWLTEEVPSVLGRLNPGADSDKLL